MIHAVAHLADPYEAGRIAVRNSELAGAGEGVFALRDLPADTVACFYHGLYLQPDEASPASNQVKEHPAPALARPAPFRLVSALICCRITRSTLTGTLPRRLPTWTCRTAPGSWPATAPASGIRNQTEILLVGATKIHKILLWTVNDIFWRPR